MGLLVLTMPPLLVVELEMVVVVVEVTQSGCPGQYPVLVFTGRGRGQGLVPATDISPPTHRH